MHLCILAYITVILSVRALGAQLRFMSVLDPRMKRGSKFSEAQRETIMNDDDLGSLLRVVLDDMNLMTPPSYFDVSLDTDAVMDVRWEVAPKQQHGLSSTYQVECSFRVGIRRNAEPICFEDRSLYLPFFQSLCVSDMAADEVLEEMRFQELTGLGFIMQTDETEDSDEQA